MKFRTLQITTLIACVMMLGAIKIWLHHGVAVSISANSAIVTVIQIEGISKELQQGRESFLRESVRVRRGRSTNRVLLSGPQVGITRLCLFGTPKKIQLNPLRIEGKDVQTLDWHDFTNSTNLTIRYEKNSPSVNLSASNNNAHLECTKPTFVNAAWFVDWSAFSLCALASLIISLFICRLFRQIHKLWLGNNSIQTEGHIVSFDVLRIVAMILVVIGHCTIILNYAKPGCALRECASFGVTLFIVMSGVSLSIGSMEDCWRTFYTKRLLTILPSYWVAYFLCAIILFSIDGRLSIDSRYPFLAILAFLGLDGFFYSQYASPYYRIGEWFVGFILILYTVAPTLHKAIMRRPIVTLLACAAISYLSIVFTPTLSAYCPLWNHTAAFNPTCRLFEFACGMAFYRYVRPNAKRYTFCAIGSATIVALYICLSSKSLLIFSAKNTIYQLSLALIIFYICDSIRYNKTIVEVISVLSSLSFLVFLYHKRIINILADNLGKVVSSPEWFIHFTLVALTVSYILAYLSVKPVKSVRGILSSCIKEWGPK